MLSYLIPGRRIFLVPLYRWESSIASCLRSGSRRQSSMLTLRMVRFCYLSWLKPRLVLLTQAACLAFKNIPYQTQGPTSSLALPAVLIILVLSNCSITTHYRVIWILHSQIFYVSLVPDVLSLPYPLLSPHVTCFTLISRTIPATW